MTTETFDLEFKADAVEDSGEFSGFASVFGGVDSFKDTIASGAFTKSLKAFSAKGRLPPLLWHHEPDKPIGRWLEMRESDTGLEVRGKLNLKVQQGAEAHALLSDGDLSGLRRPGAGHPRVAAGMDRGRGPAHPGGP